MRATHVERPNEPQSRETWALELDDAGSPVQPGDVMQCRTPRFRPPKDVKGDSEKIRLSTSRLSIGRAVDGLGASGGRVRRFCAESTVRLLDGSRLTPTNAIQAGEMHYREGGSSPYHQHVGTGANPDGAAHCYMTFKGRGVVEVGDTSQELDPGTLVYFPPGVPHRLRAHGGPLDYFEIQAWRSFKTNVLSEEKLGLKWYYEPETPDAAPVEWDQS